MGRRRSAHENLLELRRRPIVDEPCEESRLVGLVPPAMGCRGISGLEERSQGVGQLGWWIARHEPEGFDDIIPAADKLEDSDSRGGVELGGDPALSRLRHQRVGEESSTRVVVRLSPEPERWPNAAEVAWRERADVDGAVDEGYVVRRGEAPEQVVDEVGRGGHSARALSECAYRSDD
jgi:hypothetical protein